MKDNSRLDFVPEIKSLQALAIVDRTFQTLDQVWISPLQGELSLDFVSPGLTSGD